MKRALLALVVSIVLGSPALLACEKCVAAGSADPAGNVHNYPSCYNIGSGEYTWCISGYVGDSTCQKGTGDGCPEGGQCQVEAGCILNPESFDPTPALALRKCAIDVAGRCTPGGRARASFLN